MLLDIIGIIATVSSILTLPPQLYHTYKTKSGEGLSMLMLVNFFIGSLAWIAYGFMTGTVSVWFTNIVMAVSSVLMIGLKLYYRKND